jgi:hypothetical protein
MLLFYVGCEEKPISETPENYTLSGNNVTAEKGMSHPKE